MRAQFVLPVNAEDRPLVYLCGHSLGLAPRAAAATLQQELEDWQRLGVRGHEHARRPWISYAEQLQQGLAQLAGAQPQEVVAMNALSVNLHLLLASFYRPSKQRHAILIEAGAFPSDRYALAAQIGWHGFDPGTALLELAPRNGEDLLRLEDIEQRIEAESGRLALVLWPGLQYLTGQAFDLARVAQAARRAGAVIGFDLAHAIGNVPLALHESTADFAVWCSYKYLNGGPGATGGAFVHERHLHRVDLPRLSGWWGHDIASRFDMEPRFHAAPGAAGWAVSNPPIFSSAPLLASLPLFAQAGMATLRTKSLQLTGYLDALVRELLSGKIEIITPADPGQRGCQLSLRLRGDSRPAAGGHGAGDRGRRILAALEQRGVLCDWREPDVIRMAPVPLYNSYEDVLHAVEALRDAVMEHG
jgi:kynureninase